MENGSFKEVATERFSLAPSAYAMEFFRRRVATWGLVLAVPVVALSLWGALVDWRMLVVALAIVFLVVPPALMFSWFAVVSRPWAVRAVYPRVVTLSERGIGLEYFPLPRPKGDDEADNDGRVAVSAVPQSETVRYADIRECNVQGRNIVVDYSDGRFLLLPLSAFRTDADAQRFVAEVNSRMPTASTAEM